jgi:hypothetical protein
MRRIRFNIASLLLVVLMLSVGFAALRESSDLRDSALFTLTLGVLLVSILLAIHRSESRRAYWMGFSLCGSGYMALSLVTSIESRLMTTKALAYLDSNVPSNRLVIIAQSWSDFKDSHTGQTVAVQPQRYLLRNDNLTDYYRRILKGGSGTTENFVRIGHSLIALLAGWFGGLLSRRLWRVSRPPQPETVGLP